MKTYQSVLCDEFGMTLFSTGREQSCMLYSEKDYILARFGDYDQNKLLIASNSLESIEKISKKYKMKWLKKGGKKEEMPVTAISDTPLLSTSERLNAISEICYGKKNKDDIDKNLSRIEECLQLSLPDSLKQYYQLFQKQKLMMNSSCIVVKPSDLVVTESVKIKVASNFEGEGECYYFATDQMIHVEYENDDTLLLNTDDFIIMLALYQSAFVVKNNGLLAKDKIPSHLYQMFIDNRSWIISQNYKLLGIPFNDTQCLILAKRSSDLNKAEKLLHLSFSSL